MFVSVLQLLDMFRLASVRVHYRRHRVGCDACTSSLSPPALQPHRQPEDGALRNDGPAPSVSSRRRTAGRLLHVRIYHQSRHLSKQVDFLHQQYQHRRDSRRVSAGYCHKPALLGPRLVKLPEALLRLLDPTNVRHFPSDSPAQVRQVLRRSEDPDRDTASERDGDVLPGVPHGGGCRRVRLRLLLLRGNYLPDSLRHIDSFELFRSNLKAHLFKAHL